MSIRDTCREDVARLLVDVTPAMRATIEKARELNPEVQLHDCMAVYARIIEDMRKDGDMPTWMDHFAAGYTLGILLREKAQ